MLSTTSALAFGLYVAHRLWKAISAPLDELAAVARRVADGDRSARMNTPRASELVPLALAFDGMLDTLAAKDEQLRAADKLAALGRVAAGVAHEMNNPLGVIRGYVKTLHRKERDPDIAEVLATIDDEAEICQRIVEDLLTYARVPALSRREIDTADLARDVVLRSEVDAASRRIEIDVERALLNADPVRLRQVLVNLLRNALEASSGVVELVGRCRGVEYELVVRDRGSGLTAEARQRLFEPFFTTRAQGTGLGLAVSYGLVVAHQGSLIAVDREGGGTEMIVRLPVDVGSEGVAT
ncbi:MAG: HAMP domain-containing sensor histidine kinase [Polyangiaceae bacterium]